MKLFFLTAVIWVGALYAQTPGLSRAAPSAPAAAEPSPDTVLATFNGKKLTYAELQRFLSVLAPQQRQTALQNPTLLVHQYFLMQHLAEKAEKEKLDQQSPTREQLEFERRNIMVQAEINNVVNHMTADEDELKKYYETNKDKYTQVKVKTIYISFSTNPQDAGAGGTKVLSEEEAKAKIGKILADIRGGADFVKMVKQYSEDATSREKDGDLETFRKSDNMPDAIRSVVFALKQGEVGEPVRQPNGFYLFRAEAVTTRTYQQVQTEIFTEVKQLNYKKWLEQMDKSIDFKVENPAFFNAGAAPAPAAPPVK